MTSYGTAPPPPARGSIGLALVCGLGAAIGGAVVWGLIAYISKHQFSDRGGAHGARGRFRRGAVPAQ